MDVRLLNETHAQAWQQLRLESLKEAGENFGSSYEEEVDRTPDDFAQLLKQGKLYGAFEKEAFIGFAGFYIMNPPKMRHKGVLWGMYVRPGFRKQGVASALLHAIIQEAGAQVIQVHLSCITSNTHALALYKKHGFEVYGIEPRALKEKEVFFGEYLMVLQLVA
jgi:ribosomal protein S18 acetylase RimI-like enzyme